MEYTIKQLADLSGVTPRTLRWYDREGLLRPGRVTEAGYRIYGPKEVDRLQEILFYRELGFSLADIRRLLDDCPRPRDIADPWYTGNFDVTYDDIVEGCEALLDRLEREGKT